MLRKQFTLIPLMIIALLLVACGGATTPAPTGTGATNTTTSAPALGDNTVKSIIVATQSGNYLTPLDSTPDLGGTTIYFVASSPNGPGIFRVPATGGAATASSLAARLLLPEVSPSAPMANSFI